MEYTLWLYENLSLLCACVCVCVCLCVCVYVCVRDRHTHTAAQIEMYIVFSHSEHALMIEELGSTCVFLQVSADIFLITAAEYFVPALSILITGSIFHSHFIGTNTH